MQPLKQSCVICKFRKIGQILLICVFKTVRKHLSQILQEYSCVIMVKRRFQEIERERGERKTREKEKKRERERERGAGI